MVADARTGAPLAVQPVDGSYVRPGKVADWVAVVTPVLAVSGVGWLCAAFLVAWRRPRCCLGWFSADPRGAAAIFFGGALDPSFERVF
jgi:hypothetical protein